MPNYPPPDDGLTPEQRREQLAARLRAVRASKDPEQQRQAMERMDRTREEIFRKHGLVDFAVPAIRELRENPRGPFEV